MAPRRWITPFVKQCVVTCGVSINMASSGMVMGFTTGLLEQLKREGSVIPIDGHTGSWIAASPGFTLLLGNLVVPIIVSRWGRKVTNLITIVLQIAGWLCVAAADSLAVIILARSIQGFAIGIVLVFGPILIGEYSSPKYRGLFLMNISIMNSISVLAVHTMGLYMSWKISSLIFAFIMFLDLLIVVFSPKSPTWLASQGKVDETIINFRWLRGDNEEKELQKIIASNIKIAHTQHKSKALLDTLKEKVLYYKTIATRKEFYKAVIIMINLYSLGQWAGINITSVYTVDMFDYIFGKCNSPGYVISLDVQRLISTFIALIIIKNTRRRVMLLVTTIMNIAVLLLIAGYTYAKETNASLEYPLIGLILIHLHMFSIACGTLPMPLVISGEIFPQEGRSLAGGISIVFYSLSFTIVLKSFYILVSTVNIYGTYLIYAGVSVGTLIIVMVLLPETKDRMLQDIEDDFKGKPNEFKSEMYSDVSVNCDNVVNCKLLNKDLK